MSTPGREGRVCGEGALQDQAEEEEEVERMRSPVVDASGFPRCTHPFWKVCDLKQVTQLTEQ